MRRTLFYLAVVTLLVFGIGVISVGSLLVDAQDNPDKVKTVNTSLENQKTKQPEFVEIAFKDIPCEEENLKLVWNELKDRTVSINTDYVERIKDCSNLIGLNESFDLNNDGRKEIFIRSESGYFCGNNCQIFWIFQQDNKNALQKLFEAKGYLPTVKNKKTNGYKDIMFEFSATYTDAEIGIYKFNGEKYIPARCWSESKLYENKAGEMVEGKKIIIENENCKEVELLR